MFSNRDLARNVMVPPSAWNVLLPEDSVHRLHFETVFRVHERNNQHADFPVVDVFRLIKERYESTADTALVDHEGLVESTGGWVLGQGSEPVNSERFIVEVERQLF